MRIGLSWTCTLVMAGWLVGSAAPHTDPDPHWLNATGQEWSGMTPEARQAYLTGFLTGSALQEAVGAGSRDSAGLFRALDSLRREGLQFPYAPNVYAARISDYYWWQNHRPLPIWYALREVNRDLKRLTQHDGQ